MLVIVAVRQANSACIVPRLTNARVCRKCNAEQDIRRWIVSAQHFQTGGRVGGDQSNDALVYSLSGGDAALILVICQSYISTHLVHCSTFHKGAGVICPMSTEVWGVKCSS